jgi:hypothetical protein
VFYQRTWRLWRGIGRRIASKRGRERFLAVYGPLSLLGLLVVWVLLPVPAGHDRAAPVPPEFRNHAAPLPLREQQRRR